MFFWLAKYGAISLLFIMSLHYIYTFLKNTLTSPKVRDFVVKPQRVYQRIYKSLDSPSLEPSSVRPVKDMKVELQDYLKELSRSKGDEKGVEGVGQTFRPSFSANYTTL